MTDRAEDFEYEVALSFAGEDRHHVEPLAELLSEAGVRVFYDRYETAALWGTDLFVHLHDVYSKRARYVVLFASAAYSEKVWTNHERQAAQERALRERGAAYILPVRIDDTEVPGLPGTTGHISINLGVMRIFELLMQKLGNGLAESGSSQLPKAQVVVLDGLTPDATYALRSACERVLAENSIAGFLAGGEDFLLHATPPLGRMECREAIDLLVDMGYLYSSPTFGERKWIAFTVTADGFVEYGSAFLPDFEARRSRLVKHVIKVAKDKGSEFTSRIAAAIPEQHPFVCLVLQDLIEQGLLKGDRMNTTEWCVYAPSPRLKLEF